MPNDRVVPVSSRGEHGWTLCCTASVTHMEVSRLHSALCCKGCHRPVSEFLLPGLSLMFRQFEMPYSPEDIEKMIAYQGRLLEVKWSGELAR